MGGSQEPRVEPGVGGTTATLPDPPSGGAGGAVIPPETPHTVSFESTRLRPEYYAEGCAFGDFNKDGHTDLLMGPLWYEGPGLVQARELEEAKVYGYSDRTRRHFMSFTHDFDGDGWLDAMSLGYIGTDARWYRNPGDPTKLDQHWEQHTVYQGVNGEAPLLAELVAGGGPELLFEANGRLGYAVPTADATAPWVFHPISNQGFIHGLGVGDIDGDTLNDVITKDGWHKQGTGTPPTWQFNPADFSLGQEGGGHMRVFDVDGDGDNDVVTSMNGHAYGLYWFEQTRNGGTSSFTPHEILSINPGADNFSQLHALDVADFNGDGLLDLVTGKRWWAHEERDPGALDPAVLYWFQLQRTPGQPPTFKPNLVHSDSGVGLQVCAGDLNGDGRADIAAANKKGLTLHLQRR